MLLLLLLYSCGVTVGKRREVVGRGRVGVALKRVGGGMLDDVGVPNPGVHESLG